MERANRRRTRSSSGSGLDQTNGGEVTTPASDKVSQQSNASVPLKTPEAESHMKDLKESTNDVNCKGVSNGVSGGEQQSTTPVTGKKSSGSKFSGLHRELVLGLPCRGQFEIQQSSKKLGGGGKRNVIVSSNERAQRSKDSSAAAVAASSAVDANPASVNGSKKMKKYIKKDEVREDDEYTRIKKKLRYLLKRINYEQSLIDAYSLEGWKGSSVEKLRPEKELERATKEILQRKVKIRELFQHLDTLCAEGNIPESLFDSDGEISSEDIFCAKCGSKDLHIDNDIILCDGFCDRGFHQNCVVPPLRKEDIPPDDESWLCPGCACKDYSFDLLNDSLGTKLSVSDSWEKVFPEAAAAMAGGDQNLNCDLPSDDSEDEEYDPDGLNDDEGDEYGSDDSDESENEDGSSDESASDEMIGSFKDAKDIMNLPSDDSEDDDYDPDAPTCDEDKMQESSNSDNTSDSEDVETSSEGDESDHQNEVTPRGKLGRKKSQLPDVSISESDAGIDDGLYVPGRRKVARLDYKKLYDEEYENVPTSSSDDEDWDKKEDPESADEGDTEPLEQPSKAENHTFTQKPRQKPKRENKNVTLKAPQEAPRENGCSGEKSSSASSNQTNARTQRLFESFQENRYPDISTRENLAKELQMTVKQVNNWFRNTRFSTSKTMASKEDVEKLRTGKECEGQTYVAGSSKQTVETEPVTENKSGASESTSTGSRKRRRR